MRFLKKRLNFYVRKKKDIKNILYLNWNEFTLTYNIILQKYKKNHKKIALYNNIFFYFLKGKTFTNNKAFFFLKKERYLILTKTNKNFKNKTYILNYFWFFCFKNIIFIKIINFLQKKGKKETAERFLYYIFFLIKKKYNKNPFYLFFLAIEKTRPFLHTINVVRRGKIVELPKELSIKAQLLLPIKWLIIESKNKKHTEGMLSLLDISSKAKGILYEKRKQMHEKAFQNRSLLFLKK